MDKTYVATKVDGKALNARHFASKKKEEAVRLMQADKITTDPAWAAAAYDQMVKDVAAQDEKDKAAHEAKLAKANKKA